MAPKVQGAKNRRAAQIQETEVLNSVKDLSLDSVSKSITETQVEVQRVLAELSGKVMERLQELQNVEESIKLRKDELKQLHDIEVVATTIDELDAQIRDQRKAWEEEVAGKKREFAEQQSERNKVWKREEAEYQYRLSQEHRKQEDELTYTLAQNEKANREKQDHLEKTWAEREAELKKREQELADLRKFKDDSPEMVKKEVNAQVAVATNSVKKEYETKAVLAAKDAETERRLAEQQVASLQTTIAKQQEQILDLKTQLEQAHANVKEISGKALDSASGRATTEALQRLMEKDQVSSKTTK
jgi:hypothetical protein